MLDDSEPRPLEEPHLWTWLNVHTLWSLRDWLEWPRRTQRELVGVLVVCFTAVWAVSYGHALLNWPAVDAALLDPNPRSESELAGSSAMQRERAVWRRRADELTEAAAASLTRERVESMLRAGGAQQVTVRDVKADRSDAWHLKAWQFEGRATFVQWEQLIQSLHHFAPAMTWQAWRAQGLSETQGQLVHVSARFGVWHWDQGQRRKRQSGKASIKPSKAGK